MIALGIYVILAIIAWKAAEKKSKRVVISFENGILGRNIALKQAREYRAAAQRHFMIMMWHKAGIMSAMLIFAFFMADDLSTNEKCDVIIIFCVIAVTVFLTRATLAVVNNLTASRIELAVMSKGG